MDTVERGAIRDEEVGKDARLRDGPAGDVEKAGVNGVAGDGEDMMGTSMLFPNPLSVSFSMERLTFLQVTIHPHKRTSHH